MVMGCEGLENKVLSGGYVEVSVCIFLILVGY